MAWRGIRKKVRGEDGASLIELALLVGILGPVLLLGTAEVSMLLYASIELTDATHAAASYAARYYSLNSKTLPTQSQVTTAATNDAPELQNMLASGSTFTATIATGCGTGGATTGNTVPSCTSGTLPYVKVTGSATIVPAFKYLNLSSIAMTSQAQINLVN
jgi:Flp pilus assembly protein TadG